MRCRLTNNKRWIFSNQTLDNESNEEVSSEISDNESDEMLYLNQIAELEWQFAINKTDRKP